MAKKVPATIVISSPGRADKERGAGPRLTLAGDPGELTMFGAGRQGAARVEVSGDAALAADFVRVARCLSSLWTDRPIGRAGSYG